MFQEIVTVASTSLKGDFSESPAFCAQLLGK
jgi:hypothetical protein